MESQKDFWEGHHVLKRRSPSNPVIEAFALPKIKRIVSLLEPHNKALESMTLLDLGAGNGYFTYYLQRFFNVTALDFSRTILSINPVENKVQGSALRLPFKDNAFDIVFCANMLHHIDEPCTVVDEMRRVTSQYVIIIEPNRLNPFMAALMIISPEDKLIYKYSGGFLRNLVKGKLKILAQETSGFILPNKTPKALLPFFRIIEPFMYPKIYHLLITEKK